MISALSPSLVRQVGAAARSEREEAARGVVAKEKGERGAGKAVNTWLGGWGLLCCHISTGCRLDSVGVHCADPQGSQAAGCEEGG
jgi:hypothetical protein